MHVEARATRALDSDADTIVVGLVEGEGVAADLPGGLFGALLESGEARGAFKRLAVTHAGGRRFVLVGLGPRAELDAERARVAAAVVQARAAEIGTSTLCWELPNRVGEGFAAGLVEGTLLRAYRFDRYRESDDERQLERLIIASERDVTGPVLHAAAVCAAQNRARDLANTPANELTPAALASYAEQMAQRLDGLEVSALEEEQIRELGMGAFAAVAQGSTQGARLIQLRYDHPLDTAEGPTDPPPRLGLIGKAVTFDSGGLSLKPAAKMHEMKFDMAGGAAVIEAIGALVEMNAPVRVLGLVGATENLPSGSAIKPGDIVTALDGTTIEINNTDAEGRLVLADCLTLARREGCDRMIDVATLTGGVVIALGSVYAGLLCNDEAWASELERSASATGELAWRLPLHPRYAKMVSGQYARLTNTTERREASPITAAEFLHHFAGDVPWAHLDIAGTGYDVPAEYFADNGATGFGVRLLVEAATARFA